MSPLECANVCLWFLLLSLQSFLVYGEVETCRGGNFVCTTLMMYKDGFTADEGPNCDCRTCSNVWNETDGRSLTWHHYEKSDRMVQYRFCSDIIPAKICDAQPVAAIMETDVDSWNIRIQTLNCQCPGGIYFLSGWWRKGGVWVYSYVCNMPQCIEPEECAKVYVNSAGAKMGYQFNCICGDDDLCPTDTDLPGKTLADEDGQYMAKQCKRIKTSTHT